MMPLTIRQCYQYPSRVMMQSAWVSHRTCCEAAPVDRDQKRVRSHGRSSGNRAAKPLAAVRVAQPLNEVLQSNARHQVEQRCKVSDKQLHCRGRIVGGATICHLPIRLRVMLVMTDAPRGISSEVPDPAHLRVTVNVEGEIHAPRQDALVDQERVVVVEGREAGQHLKQQDADSPPVHTTA